MTIVKKWIDDIQTTSTPDTIDVIDIPLSLHQGSVMENAGSVMSEKKESANIPRDLNNDIQTCVQKRDEVTAALFWV